MASDINNVVLIGRLTRDVTTTVTQDGASIHKFPIANNYTKKVGGQWKDEVNYFDVVYFKDVKNNIGQYLLKGQQVAITGCARQDRWEKDGVKQARIVFVADLIEFLGSKPQSSESDGYENVTPTASVRTYKSKSTLQPHPEYQQFDDEVPF